MKISRFDRLLINIAPERAARRLANKQAADILRRQLSYDAAGYDSRSRNWHAINESAEITDKWSRDIVRARARDLERNSDQMNAIISATVRNVYGLGWSLQSKIGDGDSANYTDLIKQIESAWRKWKKPMNCDVTGTQSFDQLVRMMLRRKKVDGGILIVKRYTRDGFIPFKLQLFEVDELDDMTIAPKKKGDRVIGGIEYNAYNRPVGYFIRRYSIDGYRELDPIYIDAKDVIFYFDKSRPSQIREMSGMTPTITRIRDVNQYMESVSVKERILACLSVFITKQTPGSTGFGRAAIGNVAEETGGYDGKTISPGMMMELQPGESVQSVAPSGQQQDAASYVRLQQKMMAAGQGMSYESVSRDMSEVNYSSARQGAIEDEQTYGQDQESLEIVLDEIYESFVISLVLSGNVNIPDFWTNKDFYLSHEWIKPAKRWIDPIKEASANATAMLTGQKTFQTICAEAGRDWKDVIDETAEVRKYADAHGLDVSNILLGSPEGGETNGETEGNADIEPGSAGDDSGE